MGLDIYVGPLTRYYGGAWETIVQQVGRETGVEVIVMRPDDAQPKAPPEEVRAAVLEWRDAIASQLGTSLHGRLDWSELPQGQYVTDKPDWDGYGAVLLLAAHGEFPETPLPQEMPREFGRHPLWRLVERRGQPRSGLGGLFRRLRGGPAPEAPAPSPFEQIYAPQLWLPADIDGVFQMHEVTGQMVVTGSVPRLRRTLEELNTATLQGDAAAIEAWKTNGPPEDRNFQQMCRFGLACWLRLAIEADERRLPMRLDY